MKYFDLYPEPTPEQKQMMERGYRQMLGEEPAIHDTSRVYKSEVGTYTALGPNCSLRESTFGHYSYCAGDVHIVWADVGNFCSIASHTRINPGNHPYWRVTQNHCTYRRAQYGFGQDDRDFFAWREADRCTIGHDVWIGHGATIMAGASVGHGAVIGAGAVVTKKRPVGPYEIAVGMPAKAVKKRFSDPVIERLLEIEYWNWDRATLEARFDDLLDIDAFVEKYSDLTTIKTDAAD